MDSLRWLAHVADLRFHDGSTHAAAAFIVEGPVGDYQIAEITLLFDDRYWAVNYKNCALSQ